MKALQVEVSIVEGRDEIRGLSTNARALTSAVTQALADLALR